MSTDRITSSNTSFDSVISRIKMVMGLKNDQDVAEALGIKPGTFAQSKRRNSIPYSDIVTFCNINHVTVDYILLGKKPERYGEGLDLPETGQSSLAASDDFALIPRLDIEGSAGPGSVIDSENIRYLMAFRKNWLRNEVGINPDQPGSVVIITAKGNSMDSGKNKDSDIHDGDLLLVDRRVERVDADAIYTIQVDGHLIIKRIQRLIDGSVKIISDNPMYDAQIVPSAQADSIIVTGRVVFVIAGRKV